MLVEGKPPEHTAEFEAGWSTSRGGGQACSRPWPSCWGLGVEAAPLSSLAFRGLLIYGNMLATWTVLCVKGGSMR